MPVLVWKHHRPKPEVRAALQSALKRAGYDGALTWEGYRASAQLGLWGMLLDVSLEVTDDCIVVRRCEGALADTVLQECRTVLGQLFPGDGQKACSGPQRDGSRP